MNLGDRRIQNEFAAIQKDKIPGVEVKLKTMRLWHFVMRGPKDSVFYRGRYHGTLTIPQNYPNSPPKVEFTTENGRYTPRHFLCLFGHGHWLPSFTLRNVLVSIRQNFVGHAIFGDGVMAVVDNVKAEKYAKESWDKECELCGKHNEITLLDDPVEIKASPEEEKEKHQENMAVEEVKAMPKEDKKEEEKKQEEPQPQTNASEEPKRIGEWWYEVRLSALLEIREEIGEVNQDRTIFYTSRILKLISLYMEVFILKVTYNPAVVIAYCLFSISSFLTIIGILCIMLAEEEISEGCKAAIGFLLGAIVFLIVSKIYFIKRMINPRYSQPNICLLGVEAAAQLVYFWSGIAIIVYTLYDGESPSLGAIFTGIFFGAQFIRYSTQGIRISLLIIAIVPAIFEGICRAACCQPWQGVVATEVVFQEGMGVDKCVICQSEIKADNRLVGLSCHPNHVFHRTCIVEWIKYKKECPYCKTLVDKTSNSIFVESASS